MYKRPLGFILAWILHPDFCEEEGGCGQKHHRRMRKELGKFEHKNLRQEAREAALEDCPGLKDLFELEQAECMRVYGVAVPFEVEDDVNEV